MFSFTSKSFSALLFLHNGVNLFTFCYFLFIRTNHLLAEILVEVIETKGYSITLMLKSVRGSRVHDSPAEWEKNTQQNHIFYVSVRKTGMAKSLQIASMLGFFYVIAYKGIVLFYILLIQSLQSCLWPLKNFWLMRLCSQKHSRQFIGHLLTGSAQNFRAHTTQTSFQSSHSPSSQANPKYSRLSSTRRGFPRLASEQSLLGSGRLHKGVKQLQSLIAGARCAGMPLFPAAHMWSTAPPQPPLYNWLFKGPLAHCCSVKLVLLAALTQQAHQPSETSPCNFYAWYMLDKP